MVPDTEQLEQDACTAVDEAARRLLLAIGQAEALGLKVDVTQTPGRIFEPAKGPVRLLTGDIKVNIMKRLR